MSFPRYAKYKDSGVAWLGEVPAHWGVCAVRRAVDRIEQGWSPECEATPADDDTWGVLKAGCLNNGIFDASENKTLPPGLVPMPEYEVCSGDVLMSRASGSPELVGSVALVRETRPKLMLSDKIFRIRLGREISPSHFVWTMSSRPIRSQIEQALSGGNGLANNLPQSVLLAFQLAVPPRHEQDAIASFLDRETTKIDALVAEQEQLITLLKEKRQAVISHAVTKGLDPAVPMKDSGVEWLGEVPAHWHFGFLKRYWSVTDCKHLTAEFLDEGIPLASIREVQSRWVKLDDAKCTTEHFYSLLIEGGRKPQAGDLIFSRNATVGEVAQVPAEHPLFALGQDVVLLRKLDAQYSSDYLQYVIRSPLIVEQLANVMIGSTFKRVNVEEIRSFFVPFPPSAEQAAIAQFLEIETERFDGLINEVARGVDLLKERRSALISAAVTGQIDVRGLAPQEAA
jgi:type I restriction enzyme S subunit